MATRTILTLECDYPTRSSHYEGEVATVNFAVDGAEYETELCDKHRDMLMKAMAPFVSGARQRSPAAAVARVSNRAYQGKQPVTDRARSRRVRDWASSNGVKLGTRGRIPNEVLARYQDSL